MARWTPDQLSRCDIQGFDIKQIKVQKYFWIKGKEEASSTPDGKVFGFDYYVTVDQNDKQPWNAIASIKGYRDGICRLQFLGLSSNPSKRLETNCGFRENLLRACYKHQSWIPDTGAWLPGYDPAQTISIPTVHPEFKKWKNEKVANLAKRDCKPLIRLHWSKAYISDKMLPVFLHELSLAIQVAFTGPDPLQSHGTGIASPNFDLVLAEVSDASTTDMMIMNLADFGQWFAVDLLTLKRRMLEYKAIFEQLFQEKYGPDLFFCKCKTADSNCDDLYAEGNNRLRKEMLRIIEQV